MARKGLRTKSVYMNDELDTFWNELKTRYPYADMADTGVLGKLIKQEAIQTRDTVELDPMALSDIDYLIQKMTERSGRSTTRSAVVREIARDKAAEYDNKQNNAARITTIVERLTSLEKTDEERLSALELAVKELIGIIKGGSDD